MEIWLTNYQSFPNGTILSHFVLGKSQRTEFLLKNTGHIKLQGMYLAVTKLDCKHSSVRIKRQTGKNAGVGIF